MATYIMTGGASGIGATTRQLLMDEGHRVVTLDLRNADILTDLSDEDAREATLKALRSDYPMIDGVITCAGVASHFPDPGKILSINYFGTRAVIEGLIDTIRPGGRIVAISSNSAPMCANEALVLAMLDNDSNKAAALAESSNGHECYAGSKQAVARWMRRVAPEYARRGVCFNAIAPGYIETPMTEAVANSEAYGSAIKEFVASIPIGRSGQTNDVAQLIRFLLSPEAAFIAGSLIYCDGAHDAMMRTEGLF
ncbi:MAG: SDR family oxidoreductase [Luminiphilus sp.]|nr:SDR family oxidoreductase [Luminiphilus sp.]